MGLRGYGLHVGAVASLVVLDAGDPIEALRLRPDRLCVVSKGRVVSARPRARTLLCGLKGAQLWSAEGTPLVMIKSSQSLGVKINSH